MARTRMVTRTVTVTVATAMVVTIDNAGAPSASFIELELTGGTYTLESALKVAKKLHETDTLKVVSITNLEESEALYGMLETDFIKSAKRLDPTSRKLLEFED